MLFAIYLIFATLISNAQVPAPQQKSAAAAKIALGRVRDSDAKFAQMAFRQFNPNSQKEVSELAARRKAQCALDTIACMDFKIWAEHACLKITDEHPEVLEAWMKPILDGFKEPVLYEPLNKHFLVLERLPRTCAKVYWRLLSRRAEKEKWRTILETSVSMLTNHNRVGVEEKQEDARFLLEEFKLSLQPEVYPIENFRKLLMSVVASKPISNVLLNNVSMHLFYRYLDYKTVYDSLALDISWFKADDPQSLELLNTFCSAHRILLGSGLCFSALGPKFPAEKLKGTPALGFENAVQMVVAGDATNRVGVLAALEVSADFCTGKAVIAPYKASMLAAHFRVTGELKKSELCLQSYKAGSDPKDRFVDFFVSRDRLKNQRMAGLADFGDRLSDALVNEAEAVLGFDSHLVLLAKIEKLKSLAMKKNRSGFATLKSDILRKLENRGGAFFIELINSIESKLLNGANKGAISSKASEYAKGSEFLEISLLQSKK